jgi:hypothetical protein
MVQDNEVKERAKEIAAQGGVFACRAISDIRGISTEMEKLGVKVEYMGKIISGLIKEGYIPMVW